MQQNGYSIRIKMLPKNTPQEFNQKFIQVMISLKEELKAQSQQRQEQIRNEAKKTALRVYAEQNEKVIDGILDQIDQKTSQETLSLKALELFIRVRDYSLALNSYLRIKNIMCSNDLIIYAQLMSLKLNNVDD